MNKLSIALLAASLALGTATVQADSNKQKNANGQGQNSQAQSKAKNKQQNSNYDQNDNDNYEQNYDKDYSDIQRAYRESKGKGVGNKGLPPGISKNLQRGKPLPPGIAKRFDSDMASQLPYYPGREWRQVGVDAVLIDSTTQVVQEIMRDVLR